MLDNPVVNQFSCLAPGATAWRTGLCDFFLQCDLGVTAATGGRMIAQLVKANRGPEAGTGWHQHTADFHIVITLAGWARGSHGSFPPREP
jgi:hypothetical protein